MARKTFHGSHGSFDYDSEDFDRVARICIKLNPWLSGVNPETLIRDMLCNSAADIIQKPGYIGISGYMLSSVLCSDGRMYVKPSISDVLWNDSDLIA